MASSNATGDRPKQWGVTKPRSHAKPTEAERASTCRLVEVLAQSYPQKSKEERDKQKAVLDKLENIVKDWVKQLPTERAKEANTKLFSFGSYRLQVDEPGSVIDTLCVGPYFVNRERDFFIILRGKLEKMREVIGVECGPDAHIPFLSFKLDGVAIKLVYASLAYHVIPDDLDICHDSVIENIDDLNLRTLSGCRITESILALVPNLENFRTTLWCMKNWANARDIWSNVSGFLGETEWSIMVGRVCQAYPNAAPSTLVSQFFDIFATWCWPNPIMLCPIEYKGLTVWDSKKLENEDDQKHCMPIISPAWPRGNLKSDATVSTLRFMKGHFKFGDEKCKAIDCNIANWQDLFVPFKFFEEYIRYLQIDIIADNERDLSTLRRSVEPELTSLISQIEKGQDVICHPCPIEYASSDSYTFFFGLTSERIIRGVPYVRRVPDEILGVLNTWYAGWELKELGMSMRCDQVVKEQMVSRRWGKHSLPVVGQPAAVP